MPLFHEHTAAIELSATRGNILQLSNDLFLLHDELGSEDRTDHFLASFLGTSPHLPDLVAHWVALFQANQLRDAKVFAMARLLLKTDSFVQALRLSDVLTGRLPAISPDSYHSVEHQQEIILRCWCYRGLKDMPGLLANLSLINTADFPDHKMLALLHSRAGEFWRDKEGVLATASMHFTEAISLQSQDPIYRYELAYAYYCYGEFANAATELDTAVTLATTTRPAMLVRLIYFQGINALVNNQLYKAIDFFKQVIELDATQVFAWHDLAVARRATGAFVQSRRELGEALELYNQQWFDPARPKDTSLGYYYAEALLSSYEQLTGRQYEILEEVMTAYTQKQPLDPDGPGELAKILLAKRAALDHGYLTRDEYDGDPQEYREQVNVRMLFNFRRSSQLFAEETPKIRNGWKKKGYFEQWGKLLLKFEYFEEAMNVFQEALKIDAGSLVALEGLGVVCFRTGDFNGAIIYFRKALRLSPESLNLRSNLADSFRCHGDLAAAEREYQKVLRTCRHYIDALIGMGECQKALGDAAVEAEDRADAALHFQAAGNFFSQAFKYHRSDYASKLLSPEEESGLLYSSGYTKVRLFELSQGWNLPLLLGASRDFRKIAENANEHLKARATIREINKELAKQPVKRLAGSVVFVLALLIFLGTQWLAWEQYQSAGQKQYSLDGNALKSMLAKDSLADKQGQELLESLSGTLLEKFPTVDSLKNSIAQSLPGHLKGYLDAKLILETEMQPRIPLDSLTYPFFTFGSLLFIAIGLSLPAIKKIKVGAMEMEKSSVDTVKDSAVKLLKV